MADVAVFGELTRDQCEAMLKTSTHGRIAFTFHDRVDVEPIHFVFDDGWLYLRTAPGTKLSVLAHHPWVAFEVDRVNGLFEWESVVVKGTAYRIDEAATAQTEETWKLAVSVLRRLVPAALTDADPIAGRTIVLRIHVDELSGRSCTMRASAP